MKKVVLVFAIIIANGVFISCNDLNESLENQPLNSEVSATGGEDTQDPDYDDDDDGIAGGNQV